MRFRNALRVLLHNFKNIYVILLFRLAVFLVVGSIVALIVFSGIGSLLESQAAADFVLSLQKIVKAFFDSTSYAEFDGALKAAIESVVGSFGGILAFLNQHLLEIIFSVIGIVALYLVDRFLNGMAHFALGGVLNDKMSQYADTPFFIGFFNNVGGAAIYQIVYVPMAFAYDVVTLALCYLIFFRLFFFLPVLVSLFFAVTFIIVSQAIKLALVSDWMPAVIADGKKLSKAIQESFSMGAKSFGVHFSNYLVAIYCILALNTVFALTSFFSSLLITIPASQLFITCLQFVSYYTAKNKRYFLTYTHICQGGSLESILNQNQDNGYEE